MIKIKILNNFENCLYKYNIQRLYVKLNIKLKLVHKRIFKIFTKVFSFKYHLNKIIISPFIYQSRSFGSK